MEHSIEALESAVTAVILALAIAVFLSVSSASDKGEKSIVKNIFYERLIIAGDINE